MSVADILKEVEKLTPAERWEVAEALASSEESINSVQKRQNELNRRLLAEGLLKRIPKGKASGHKFKPIKIKGRPLSETIIEGRR